MITWCFRQAPNRDWANVYSHPWGRQCRSCVHSALFTQGQSWMVQERSTPGWKGRPHQHQRKQALPAPIQHERTDLRNLLLQSWEQAGHGREINTGFWWAIHFHSSYTYSIPCVLPLICIKTYNLKTVCLGRESAKETDFKAHHAQWFVTKGRKHLNLEESQMTPSNFISFFRTPYIYESHCSVFCQFDFHIFIIYFVHIWVRIHFFCRPGRPSEFQVWKPEFWWGQVRARVGCREHFKHFHIQSRIPAKGNPF